MLAVRLRGIPALLQLYGTDVECRMLVDWMSIFTCNQFLLLDVSFIVLCSPT